MQCGVCFRQLRTCPRTRASARAKSASEILRPICFALFRLTASSNFVVCSMGKSFGCPPCKILCTYLALRRSKAGPSAPYDIRPPASTKARVVEAAGKRCSNPIDAWWTSCLEQAVKTFGGLLSLGLKPRKTTASACAALDWPHFPSWDLSNHSTSFARAGWKARRSSRREAVGDALLQSKY